MLKAVRKGAQVRKVFEAHSRQREHTGTKEPPVFGKLASEAAWGEVERGFCASLRSGL